MARGGGGGGGGRWSRWKVTPNLAADQEGTRLLNLTVLRRLDPAVADILITAAHVTTYSFDVDKNEWSRKGVEGSLFVVKRNTQPRFQFIVMNRRNTENLVEDLLRDFEFQVQVPYIMYHNAADEVTGIWFYNPQECEEVGHVFSRIHNAFSRASPKTVAPAIRSNFEEPEVTSAGPSVEDTIEQPTSSAMVPDDDEYKLLSALFTAAACVGGAPTGGTSAVQPSQSARAVPSSRHASPSVISSQSPALHNLLTSRTSAPVMPPDAHISTCASTNQPASLAKPLLFPPLTTLQTITAPSFSSSARPPLHPPLAIQHQQSAPLLQPFSLTSASSRPPYGAPLIQPFPPPNPSPLLTPAASYGPLLTRDKVRGAMLKLVEEHEEFPQIRLACGSYANHPTTLTFVPGQRQPTRMSSTATSLIRMERVTRSFDPFTACKPGRSAAVPSRSDNGATLTCRRVIQRALDQSGAFVVAR